MQGINIKHISLLHTILLWQHALTLLNHYQAFQRTDSRYHNS